MKKVLLLTLALMALFINAVPLAAQTYDVLIKGGSVVDGSGGAR